MDDGWEVSGKKSPEGRVPGTSEVPLSFSREENSSDAGLREPEVLDRAT